MRRADRPQRRPKPIDRRWCLIAVDATGSLSSDSRWPSAGARPPGLRWRPNPPADRCVAAARGSRRAGRGRLLRLSPRRPAKYQAVRAVAGAPAAAIDQATAGARSGRRAAGHPPARAGDDRRWLSEHREGPDRRERSCGRDACQAVAQVLDIVDLLPTRSAGVIMRVPGQRRGGRTAPAIRAESSGVADAPARRGRRRIR